MLIFISNKFFRKTFRYSRFEIKIPEYSDTSKCSIKHILNFDAVTWFANKITSGYLQKCFSGNYFMYAQNKPNND